MAKSEEIVKGRFEKVRVEEGGRNLQIDRLVSTIYI